MRQHLKRVIKPITLIAMFGLSACARNPSPEPEAATPTVTICDPSGCAERPKDYASFDPAKDGRQMDSDERIPALEEIAKKDPRAAYDLALRFFRGDGVRRDSYQAIRWMREAGERGVFEAQKALGRIYLTGLEEMGSDPAEAQKWLQMSAARGDREAQKLLVEATAARKDEDDYNRWISHYRSIFSGYWNSGYNYLWGWQNNGWYPYGGGYGYSGPGDYPNGGGYGYPGAGPGAYPYRNRYRY